MNRILNSTTTFLLPDAASGVVDSDSIDFKLVADGSRLNPVEFELVWPAIAAADLANGSTVTLSVSTSDDDSSWTVLYPSLKVLTGATAGLAAGVHAFAIPAFSGGRYVKVTATADDTSSFDASGVTATVNEYC